MDKYERKLIEEIDLYLGLNRQYQFLLIGWKKPHVYQRWKDITLYLHERFIKTEFNLIIESNNREQITTNICEIQL